MPLPLSFQGKLPKPKCYLSLVFAVTIGSILSNTCLNLHLLAISKDYAFIAGPSVHTLLVLTSFKSSDLRMLNTTTEISPYINCSDQTLGDEDIKRYANIEWVLDGVVNIVICSIGIVANLLSIPVLLSKRITNVFYRTLAVLALFDTIFLVCDLLESIRRNHYLPHYCEETPFHQTTHMFLFPRFLRPLQNIAMVASIYATIVVALGRYLAVAKPISTMVNSGKGNWKTVLVYLIPVVIFSVIFKLPIFFEFYTEWCSVHCLIGKPIGRPYCAETYNVTNTSQLMDEYNITDKVLDDYNITDGK